VLLGTSGMNMDRPKLESINGHHHSVPAQRQLALKTRSNLSLNWEYRYASWNASVGKIAWRLLLSSKSDERKKLTPGFPSAKPISANVWAMVGFLVRKTVQPEYTVVLFI
jgi:hypothetical protein